MDKKAFERKVVDEVCHHYNDFPIGTIQDFEEPDFIINENGRIIGIEVTRYIRKDSETDEPKRHEEIVLDRVLQNAQELFTTKQDIPLFVTALPLPGKITSMSKSQRNIISKSLAEIVENNIPQEIYQNLTIDIDFFDNNLLYGVFSSITIMRCKKDSRWVFSDGDWIDASKNEIQNLIDAKNEKYKNYMVSCDEAWLIIVAEENSISSIISIEGIISHPFESYFEKILFYFRNSETVVELRVNHKTIGK